MRDALRRCGRLKASLPATVPDKLDEELAAEYGIDPDYDLPDQLAERTYRSGHLPPPPKPPKVSKCRHRGDRTTQPRKGLCSACVMFSRRHDGKLTSDEVLRDRRMQKDAPVAHRP